jgi:hypothetical protein
MKRILIPLLLSIFVVAAVSPLLAHHGRGATYDVKQVVPLKGTVTQVYWRNPHITIFLDVKGSDGKVTNWTIEHSPPIRLTRMGYNKETVHPGMEVTIYVNPGNKGLSVGLLQKVILPDGKEVFNRADGDLDPLD